MGARLGTQNVARFSDNSYGNIGPEVGKGKPFTIKPHNDYKYFCLNGYC